MQHADGPQTGQGQRPGPEPHRPVAEPRWFQNVLSGWSPELMRDTRCLIPNQCI
jgi:hypothetical protein